MVMAAPRRRLLDPRLCLGLLLWLWLTAAGSTAAGGAIRCPALVAVGDYLNQTDHHDGHYHLRLTGERVTATFSTSRSAVAAGTREGPAPLFTVPSTFRPPYPILRTVVGQPVRADGNLDPDRRTPRRFLLQVGADGAVHYGDQSPGADYLTYALQTIWGTTPAANDHAVLQILDADWFGETVLSQQPPPVQTEIPAYEDKFGSHPAQMAGPYVTLDAEGRVTTLGAWVSRGYALAELGELHELTDLNLEGIPVPNTGMFDSHDEFLEYLEQEGLLRKGLSPERARQLYLYGLVGEIPPQLGQLKKLRHLNLSRNLLTGAVPLQVTHLASLEILDLSANLLTGDLPGALGPLQHLQRLLLSHNQFTGPLPPEWGKLQHLRWLFLGSNQLTGPLPPEWGQLTNLQILWLYNNQLTGPLPPEWGQLHQLQSLELYENQLAGPLPPAWGHLTNLKTLHLRGNQLTSISPELGQLTNLSRLDLSHNPLAGCVPAAWQAQDMNVLGLFGLPFCQD